MSAKNCWKMIEDYSPRNDQEKADQLLMLAFLKEHEDAFLRSNLTAHFTASAWITSNKRDQVLLIHHNIYNTWTWCGGHADGQTDLLAVALTEAKEETGLKELKVLDNSPLSLEVLTVNGHYKAGHWVPGHLHLNLTFLLEADPRAELAIKADENSGVAWFAPEAAIELNRTAEPWFAERIYPKLNERLKEY